METRQLIGIGALYLGFSMAAGCWYSFRRVQRWLATSTVAEGRVTAVRKGPWSADYEQATYLPTIAFHTPDGQRVEITLNMGTTLRDYAVGRPITIRYQQSQPHDARLDERFCIWLAPIVTGSLGFWALVAGLVLTFTTIN